MARTSLFLIAIMSIACSRDKELRLVTYHDNGALRSEVLLINGVKEGEGIDYFADGKIEGKVFWKHGNRDGEEIVYFENGNIQQVSLHKNGICLWTKDYATEGYVEEVRVYDSLKRIIDYRKFNKDGTRNFSSGTKDPIFIPAVDTVVVGEYLEAEVRLGNRQYSHVDVIIGDVEDEQIIQKNKPLPKKDSLTSILKIKADSVGLREVSGVVFERSQKWDSMAVIPFTHRYYVKPK